jgi:hypothetical protein
MNIECMIKVNRIETPNKGPRADRPFYFILGYLFIIILKIFFFRVNFYTKEARACTFLKRL